MSELPAVARGDTWILPEFTLGGGWLCAHFAEMWWTLRYTLPATSVTDDTDAAVQVTLSGGEIVPNATDDSKGNITVPDDETLVEPGKWYWDLQGRTGAGATYTLSSGRIVVSADITRS